MRLQGYFTLAFIIIIFLIQPVLAHEHYSYEHAMELKPLINWQDYGPKAFDQSISENKPILLLLTAPSWCYWCQVYESEEYLFNPQVIETLNNNFIPVYVDADKRQDLTRQYLEGGWPSTTVLAPNGDRLYGYSGVRPLPNMLANFQQAINYVNTQGFSNEVSFNYEKTSSVVPTENQLNNIISNYQLSILQSYDSVYGGFGGGQKFPQPRTLDFSLELYETTGNDQWLNLVRQTLEGQYTKIDEVETNYNLFDTVEGGFHRYTTQRDWRTPHYEKMLYDNARLLKTYSHLLQLDPSNTIAIDVVDKTDSYIQNYWYDEENGGFYGNTDVHGEEEYYGKNPRPEDKPRIEKTKYTDWNSEAIITYLYLWKTKNDERYKELSINSLDFFKDEMITSDGAYHYKKEDGEIGVRGGILDNSYLLLAFVEGYEVLNDKEYLETAQKIADYSLDNLYDWNSGGFFERNSPDKNLYAPGENINLDKPTQENGIIAYALLKLYKQTNNPLYLNAGIKTLGNKLNNIGGLDFSYYYIKSSQFAIENNLLGEYNKQQSNIQNLEEKRQENFWLNDLIGEEKSTNKITDFQVSEEGISQLQGSLIILILISLIAGFISFISPCTLPILPAYIAFSLRSSKNNLKGMTIAFFLGLVTVFTILGMSASIIGVFLRSNLTIFSQIAGAGIIFFGILILLGKGLPGIKIKQKKPTSYIGSFLFGGALGIAWTPCVGPILVAILLLASASASVSTGGILLLAYGIGLAVPLIIFSSYLGKIKKDGKIWRIIKGKEIKIELGKKEFSIHTSSLIAGLIFIILGYLIFSGILFSFNQYISATEFQKVIFGIEEKLIKLLR